MLFLPQMSVLSWHFLIEWIAISPVWLIFPLPPFIPLGLINPASIPLIQFEGFVAGLKNQYSEWLSAGHTTFHHICGQGFDMGLLGPADVFLTFV